MERSDQKSQLGWLSGLSRLSGLHVHGLTARYDSGTRPAHCWRIHLKKGFLKMESSVCIVGGCGHIGLPLGMALAEVGVPVTLFDIDVARVRLVAAGQMPFLERGAERILPHLLSTDRLKVTTSPEVIRQHDIVVVTIGTPVDEFMDPECAIVRSRDRPRFGSHARWSVIDSSKHGLPRRHDSPRSPRRGAGIANRHRPLPGADRPGIRLGGTDQVAPDRRAASRP